MADQAKPGKINVRMTIRRAELAQLKADMAEIGGSVTIVGPGRPGCPAVSGTDTMRRILARWQADAA